MTTLLIIFISCSLLLISIGMLIFPKAPLVTSQPQKTHEVIELEDYVFEYYKPEKKEIDEFTETKCCSCPLNGNLCTQSLPDPRDIHNKYSRFSTFCVAPGTSIGKPIAEHERNIINSYIPTAYSVRWFKESYEVIVEEARYKEEEKYVICGGSVFKFGKGDCSTCTFDKQREDPRFPGYKSNRYSKVQFPNICTFCRCPGLGIKEETEEILRVYQDGRNSPNPLFLIDEKRLFTVTLDHDELFEINVFEDKEGDQFLYGSELLSYDIYYDFPISKYVTDKGFWCVENGNRWLKVRKGSTIIYTTRGIFSCSGEIVRK